MGHSDGTVRRHWAMHVRVIVPVPCARTYLWHLSHLAEQVLLRLHAGLGRSRGQPSWMHGETTRKVGRTAGLDGRHHGQTGERADMGRERKSWLCRAPRPSRACSLTVFAWALDGCIACSVDVPCTWTCSCCLSGQALHVLGSKANAPTNRVRAAPGNSVCQFERRVERRPFLAHPNVKF